MNTHPGGLEHTLEIDNTFVESRSTKQAALRNTDLKLENLAEPVHFIGIGGIGMSALARLLLNEGKAVSGSDKQAGEITQELEAMGAKIYIGHQAENVAAAGCLVISTAIVNENPELASARARSLPVYHRSEMLSAISAKSKTVAVTGTHGKTTTTGMVAQVLIDGGLDPSVVVGGIFERIGSNARYGKGGYFVAEADESDGTHARLASHVAIITNIEPDHLENYPGGMAQIEEAMLEFSARSQKVIVCLDDAGCRHLLQRISKPTVTYGRSDLAPEALYRYDSLPGFAMRVYKGPELLGQLTLKVPGEHNKQNALAAIVTGMELGIAFDTAARSMETFGGVARRFQIKGEVNGTVIVDDYAHHPTEVVATLQAAKQYLLAQNGNGTAKTSRVVAVFQPHQPGRLRDLWQEFLKSFQAADLVLITDIYVARGGAIEGITSQRFVSEMNHANVKHLAGKTADLPTQIAGFLEPNDLVLTIGAGDITDVGSELIKCLKKSQG
ncbi:MAG: UDP-N-acetylmuramate--L-alanine ligase [Cyanobacteria bacterium PR.3.49]|nr:UDP-N-acetylmuramate--L-alanine ligase [Cyanobacteria bacterium PR.3.49]